MKRLFEVDGEFFDCKKDAKDHRGEKIGENKDGSPVYKHEIHRGPDHWLGPSR